MTDVTRDDDEHTLPPDELDRFAGTGSTAPTVGNDTLRGSPDATWVRPKRAGQPGNVVDAPSPSGGPHTTFVPPSRDATLARRRTPERAEGEFGTDATSVAGLLLADRFEVISILGEGGMGTVYRVRDRQIEGREVALKVLREHLSFNEKFRTLFFQEIRAAQNFVSEHVVQVRDTGRMSDGRLFLTMDLVHGQPLQAVLRRESALLPRHALEVTRQVLLGLASGHEKGFIHRDIKPSNVMLLEGIPKTDDNPHGVGVRVLDFGIAALAAEAGETTAAGTPAYMAPEQARGERLDPRADLFAVGILLYEMLIGTRPFPGVTLEEVTRAHTDTQITPQLAEYRVLSRPLRKLLSRALQKDREKRFQSASEFARAIEKSRAFRNPEGVPLWAWGVMAALTVAVGALAVRGTALQSEVEAAERRADTESADRATADARAVRLERERSDLESEVRAMQRRIDALDKENGELTVAVAGFTVTKVASADADVKVGNEAVDRLNDSLEEERSERNKLESKVDELSKKLSLLSEENETLKTQQSAEFKRALAYANILDLVESGAGETAAKKFDNVRVSDGIFKKDDADGAEFVEALVRCASALERFENSVGSAALDVAALTEARQQSAELTAHRAAFEIASRSWIDFELPGRSEPIDIQAATNRTLDGLNRGIEATSARYQQLHDQDFEALRNVPALEKGAEKRDHCAVYGDCQHAAEFAEKLIEALPGHFTRLGKLDVDRLKSYHDLDAWGEFVDARRAEIAPKRVDEFGWFWCARLWYGEQKPVAEGEFPFDRPVPTTLPESASQDWRAVLALELALLDSKSIFRSLASQELLVFAQSNQKTPGADEIWYLDVLDTELLDTRAANAQPGDPVGLRRRTFTKNGTRPSESTIAYSLEMRPGAGLIAKDRTAILNLRSNGEGVSAASWRPKQREKYPDGYGFPLSEELDGFLKGLVERPEPCLVVRTPEAERWFSPRLGLVREDQGDFRTELVFARTSDRR